jgi:hypothetical protein
MAKATFGIAKMNIDDPDSPARRLTIAIVTAVAITALAALVYSLFVSKPPSVKFNGAAIVAAAQSYTRDLQARKQPIPKSVSLDDLVAAHFLRPEEVAAFRGMKATVMLTTEANNPQFVLMRVHFPDGSDIALMGDGSVQQLTH